MNLYKHYELSLDMETQTRVVVTFFVLVALIAGTYVFSDWFSKTTGYVLGEDQKIAFAQCIADKGAVFYQTERCVACEEQRTLFGERAWELIEKKVCDERMCTGLTSLPAWELEGKIYYGFKTFNELDALSSCEITPVAS